MEIRLKKQAQKYLDSVDEPTRKKLYKALDQLAQYNGPFVKTTSRKKIVNHSTLGVGGDSGSSMLHRLPRS